jgi:two-component system OmpR family sensor kinase
MSLRLRLTLLYTNLLGGVVLVLGFVVYLMVSVTLINEIDLVLTTAVSNLIPTLRVDAVGNLNVINLPSLRVGETVFIQVWGRDQHLVDSSDNIQRYNKPLDPRGTTVSQPVFREVEVEDARLRVVSVPLVVNERPVGLLQVGTSLGLLDTTQRVLLTVMVITAMIAMALGAIVGWLVFGQALYPLEIVTEAATQITRADDLSRRIPVSGRKDDEVGQLIEAFNQTLGRLEGLFNTQRRFLADVSHELRTPLTVIKGNVGLMRRFKAVDEESLTSIDGEVDRLARLVGDLLLLAQAESGKIPLDMKSVALDTVVLEVFQQLRVLAGERLQVKLVEIDQVSVIGDRDRLKQVLLNLGGNAIKFTPNGGQVIFGLYKSDDQARVIVSDTGPGIKPEDLPHIFERFYRGEKSRTRPRSDSSGFGLGLSIAYWIARNHGGRIEVDSKPNQGTTFAVWLPLAKDNPAPAVKKAKEG